MSVYFKTVKGIRRTNEDRHVIFNNITGSDKTKNAVDMFGIFDGHGGALVSSVLTDIMPKIFSDKRTTFPLYKVPVTKICNNVQSLIDTNYKSRVKECGSTCLMVFHYKNNNDNILSVLNVGDSRAILCTGQEAVKITNDHKPLYPTEKQRIIEAGGKIYCDGTDWRVANLSLSRAFGDTATKFTHPSPDLFHHHISKNDKFIVLACDGLWDVMDNQSVVNFILHNCYDMRGKRINEKTNIADKLAHYALNLGSGDNISIIIVFF